MVLFSTMTYPVPAQEIVEVLTELCRQEKKLVQVELLSIANSRFEKIGYDNWNGGTTSWALRLYVPVVQFATINLSRGEIEKDLLAKLGYLDSIHPNDPIGCVTVLPLPNNHVFFQQPSVVDQSARIWHGQYLRILISHTSKYKAFAIQLKASLFELGVTAFVAHEDIQPTLEWQRELQLALNSMHVLVALVTEGFQESAWTNQEIGWALGRGIVTIPIKLGSDPCGFMSAKQALPGAVDNLGNLADRIVDLTLRDDFLRPTIRSAITIAMMHSVSFRNSRRIAEIIKSIDSFNESERNNLQTALKENRQVYQATGVPEIINRLAMTANISDMM